MKRYRDGSTILSRIIRYVFLIILGFVALYPFLWMFLSALKSDGAILNAPTQLWMGYFDLSGYKTVLNRIPFLMLYKNTLIFAGSITASGLLFGSMAGYAYAKLQFKGKNVIFMIVLSSIMIPFQVTMIPLFIELKVLGLLNTLVGLILPRACGMFEVFMLRNFFIGLPTELQEAARIDGCSEFRIYWQIMLPLCKPAFLSCGLFVFNANWNDLLYPLIFATKDSLLTLQAGIATLLGIYVVEYSIMMAGAVLSVLPILIVYVILQKYFVQGIAMSGLKE